MTAIIKNKKLYITLTLSTLITLVSNTDAKSEQVKTQPGITNLDTMVVQATIKPTHGKTKSSKKTLKQQLRDDSVGESLPGASGKPQPGETTTQTLDKLPNVTVQGGPRSINQNPAVRGLSQDRVNIAVDGISNDTASFGHNSLRLIPDAKLLKRVNVSYNGSNILYGSGSEGGTINYVTLDPADFLQPNEKIGALLSQNIQIGTPGWQTNAAVFGQMKTLQFLFDIVTGHSNDVVLPSGHGLEYSANDNLQGLFKLVWQVNPYSALKLSYLGLQNKGNFPAITSINTNPINPPSAIDLNQQLVTLGYHYTDNPDLPLLNLNAKVYYQKVDQTLTPLGPSKGFVLPQHIMVDTVGTKIYNVAKLTRQEILFGISASGQHGSDGFTSHTTGNFPSADNVTYASFLQDRIHLLPKLLLTLGMRYDGYSSHSADLSNKGSHFGKNISLRYHLNKIITFFAGLNDSFKMPSLVALYLGGAHPGPGNINFVPNPQLQPEEGHNKEIGFSIKQAGVFNASDAIHFKADYFYTDINNYIAISEIQGAPAFIYQRQNISRAQLSGYEFSLDYRLPWLITHANFAWTKGKNLDSYTGFAGFVPANSPLPGVPAASGNLDIGIPLKRIDSRLDWATHFALAANDVPPGINKIPGFITVDLRYTWTPHAIKGLQFIVAVNNLFNKYYQIYNGSIITLPQMGRNIILTASYRF